MDDTNKTEKNAKKPGGKKTNPDGDRLFKPKNDPFNKSFMTPPKSAFSSSSRNNPGVGRMKNFRSKKIP